MAIQTSELSESDMLTVAEALVRGNGGQPVSEATVRQAFTWARHAIRDHALLSLVTKGLIDMHWDSEGDDWGFKLREAS
jgi:hypothetical protein